MDERWRDYIISSPIIDLSGTFEFLKRNNFPLNITSIEYLLRASLLVLQEDFKRLKDSVATLYRTTLQLMRSHELIENDYTKISNIFSDYFSSIISQYEGEKMNLIEYILYRETLGSWFDDGDNESKCILVVVSFSFMRIYPNNKFGSLISQISEEICCLFLLPPASTRKHKLCAVLGFELSSSTLSLDLTEYMIFILINYLFYFTLDPSILLSKDKFSLHVSSNEFQVSSLLIKKIGSNISKLNETNKYFVSTFYQSAINLFLIVRISSVAPSVSNAIVCPQNFSATSGSLLEKALNCSSTTQYSKEDLDQYFKVYFIAFTTVLDKWYYYHPLANESFVILDALGYLQFCQFNFPPYIRLLRALFHQIQQPQNVSGLFTLLPNIFHQLSWNGEYESLLFKSQGDKVPWATDLISASRFFLFFHLMDCHLYQLCSSSPLLIQDIILPAIFLSLQHAYLPLHSLAHKLYHKLLASYPVYGNSVPYYIEITMNSYPEFINEKTLATSLGLLLGLLVQSLDGLALISVVLKSMVQRSIVLQRNHQEKEGKTVAYLAFQLLVNVPLDAISVAVVPVKDFLDSVDSELRRQLICSLFDVIITSKNVLTKDWMHDWYVNIFAEGSLDTSLNSKL